MSGKMQVQLYPDHRQLEAMPGQVVLQGLHMSSVKGLMELSNALTSQSCKILEAVPGRSRRFNHTNTIASVVDATFQEHQMKSFGHSLYAHIHTSRPDGVAPQKYDTLILSLHGLNEGPENMLKHAISVPAQNPGSPLGIRNALVEV